MDRVVLEYGTGTFRAGGVHTFPSDEEPRVQTPNAVEDMSASVGPDGVVAEEPTIVQAVERGEIVDLAALESLMFYTLYELLSWEIGREGTIVIVEPVGAPRRARELLAQLLFEVFNVEAMTLHDAAACSLFATGRHTGCVVDIGHGKVDVACVAGGQTNTNTAARLEYGGQDLNNVLHTLLVAQGLPPMAEEDVQTLKDMCCKVADSCAAYQEAVGAVPPAEPSTYTLPDGQQFSIANEGLQIGESFLDPSILHGLGIGGLMVEEPSLRAYADGPPLARVVSDVLTSTTSFKGNAAMLDDKGDKLAEPMFGGTVNLKLASSTLVCGGGSLIPGLRQRLIKEVREASPESSDPKLINLPPYMPEAHTLQHAAWLGGVVVARTVSTSSWFNRYDYSELGPHGVQRIVL